MQDILIKSIIISVSVIAIWASMLYGMILAKVREFKVPECIKKPLYDCPICMVPYYGSILYWFLKSPSVKEWPFVILVSMGIVTIFAKIKRN